MLRPRNPFDSDCVANIAAAPRTAQSRMLKDRHQKRALEMLWWMKIVDKDDQCRGKSIGDPRNNYLNFDKRTEVGCYKMKVGTYHYL